MKGIKRFSNHFLKALMGFILNRGFHTFSSRLTSSYYYSLNYQISNTCPPSNADNDSFFSHKRTVYVVSDSQLEEIKRNQREEELENIETSRKRLEESYQARVKVLDDREHELQEEIKALAPVKKDKKKVTA